jgi:hypothetical protein
MLKSYAKRLDPSATSRNPRATDVGQPFEATALTNFRSKFNLPQGVATQGFCVL